MIPRSFDYLRPNTLAEAVQLLSNKEDAKVLAGGQSLIALMKLRLASPKYIIDLTGLNGLSYIKEQGEKIFIGALTTHDTYEQSDLIRRRCSILSEAAGKVGDQQIRNRGTLAGTLCHADPSADIPVTMLALDGEIVVQGPKGERIIKAKDFFIDYFTTAVNPDEVVKEVRVPVLSGRTGSAYIKHARREGDFAIASCAAIITLDEKGKCKQASISLGSVGPTPLRAIEVEKALVGNVLNDDVIAKAAEKAVVGISPPSDIHGSAQYRTEMAKVFTKRTIRLAVSRIGA